MIPIKTVQANYIKGKRRFHRGLFVSILDELRGKPFIQILDHQIQLMDLNIDLEVEQNHTQNRWPLTLEHKYSVGPLLSYKGEPVKMAAGYDAHSFAFFFPTLKALSYGPEYVRNGEIERVKYYERDADTKVMITAWADDTTDDILEKLAVGYKRYAAKRTKLEKENAKTRADGEAKQLEYNAAGPILRRRW